MSDYEGNPRDRLVHLHMVDPFNIDPPPDQSVQGRLARMLKSVGSKGTLAVRARMITSVSNTKFKTIDGKPISMVGLHGKDEVLAVGPTWAIERLGDGDVPEFEEEVSLLKEALRIYRLLGELACSPIDSEEIARRNSTITFDLDKAYKQIRGYDENGRIAARAFVDSVVAKLETYVADCENGEVPWWHFWSQESTEMLEGIGLFDFKEISFMVGSASKLLQSFDPPIVADVTTNKLC